MGHSLRTSVLFSIVLLHAAVAAAQPQQQPPPPPPTGWGQPAPAGAQPGWGQQQAQQAPPPGWGAETQVAPSPPPPPPPPPAAVAPAAVEPADDAAPPSDSGFLIRARLPSAFPLGFTPHAGPLLELGLVLGKLQLHVGLAVTTGSLSDEYEDVDGTYTDEVSVLALIAAPGVSFVTFESDDHRARLLLQGRFLVGTLNASGGDGERSQDALVLGAAGSALGEYRVHSSFGTGIEAGYGLAFASSSEGSSKTSASMTGLFVAFTGTIYLGGN